MTIIIILCLVIVGSLALQVFFSAAEMAFISLDYIKLKNRAERNDTKAAAVVYFLEHPKFMFGTSLLGTNLGIVLASATASYLMSLIVVRFDLTIDPELQSLITAAATLPLVLFVGQIIPMGYSRLHPEWLVSKGITLFAGSFRLLYPFVRITSVISSMVSKMFRAEDDFHSSLITRDELESYISDSVSTTTEPTNVLMGVDRYISESFHFSKTSAAEVMVPVANTHSISATANVGDVYKSAAQNGHSRLPVFSDKSKSFTGYLHTADVIGLPKDMNITDLIRKPFMLPETITLSKLFPAMQSEGKHMAMLTDPDGIVTGLITDEDAIEEIFGHIYDEHDHGVVPDNPDEISINGEINIADINKSYGLHIPESRHYQTLAGFLIYSLKSIPSPGAVVVIEGLTFTIDSSTDRKITSVRITLHD